MNELISKAVGMVCAIGQVIGNLFKKEGEGDTTAAAGNNLSADTIKDSTTNAREETFYESSAEKAIDIKPSSHTSYDADFYLEQLSQLEQYQLFLMAHGFSEDMIFNVEREILMNLYLMTVQDTINSLSPEQWANLDAYKNIRAPSPQIVKFREQLVERLKEIDFAQGEKAEHQVTKSQIMLLGKLRGATYGPVSYAQYDIKSDGWLTVDKHGLRIGWERLVDANGNTTDEFEQMNAALNMAGLTDSKSIQKFFVQCSGESGMGGSYLQEGKPVKETGGSPLQVTGPDNYERVAKELGVPEIGRLNEANSLDATCGPGLAASKYPWQTAAIHWKKAPCTVLVGKDGKPAYVYRNGESKDQIKERVKQAKENGAYAVSDYNLDKLASEGADILVITNKMQGSGAESISSMPGSHNYREKYLLDNYTTGLYP